MEETDRREVAKKRRDVDILMATVTKHYIRRHVWLSVASERSKKIGGPIQYFTLTTGDLFDVKVLAREGLIERNRRGFPGLGFCEYDDKTYDSILRNLRWCRWSHKGYFEKMVTEHPAFASDFSFDVINLDFILVPFPGQDSPLEGTWGAIQKLLQVQWRQRKGFDLFLTFRGTRNGTNEEALHSVVSLIRSNLQSGRGATEFQSRLGHQDPSRLLEEDYVEFLCLGLPKLLVGDALQIGFEVTRSEVYKYPRSSGDDTYDIVKFVMSFDLPMLGQHGFGAAPAIITNYDAAVPLIFKTPIKNVADILESCPSLATALAADIQVLQAAGL